MGDFPEDLSNDGPFVFSPGIVIPTTPWDSLWNSVSQWFGVSNEADLDKILPNRGTFDNLFTLNDFCMCNVYNFINILFGL